MYYEVKLQNLGEDVADEATVSYWLVDEGDVVNEGDDLVEMSMDEAPICVVCPKSGVVFEKLVEEGDEVSVGDVLCILEI